MHQGSPQVLGQPQHAQGDAQGHQSDRYYGATGLGKPVHWTCVWGGGEEGQ